MKNIFLVLVLGFLINCGDRADVPAGNKTFSCKINGNLFTPKYSDLNSSPTNKGLYIDKGINNWKDLLIIAQNSDTQTKVILYVKDYAIGTFDLFQSNGNLFPLNNQTTQATLIYNGQKFLSKDNASGQIIITHKTDTDIKGSFELKLYSEDNPSNYIIITEGRFDD
ncbi:DUF6252 family protein [Kaistella polysaccharea]|uniref:DUF6252 family protein n=1 Tax=Kaistella polysaccharea TaxID=2878534 RepID=UPI001CF26C1E|nr:DUF6252 family protein [Kaistella polysaccharea]